MNIFENHVLQSGCIFLKLKSDCWEQRDKYPSQEEDSWHFLLVDRRSTQCLLSLQTMLIVDHKGSLDFVSMMPMGLI